MSQPGSFGSIVEDKDWVVRKVQELERKINEQAAANPFTPMGISPKAGGIDVVGFLETLRADGSVSLRMATGGGAFEVCDSSGASVARFGLMEHANPGQYGVELVYLGSWVQVGAGAVDWTNISNIPATFPPSAHTHAGTDVTSRVGASTDAIGSNSGYNNTVSGTSFVAAWLGNDASFSFGRNTSSIKYKQNVREHRTDPADVLELVPVLYDRIPEAPHLAPTNEYGLIAEQVHEHCPELVTWFDGQIDGIRYDLVAVALLDVVKQQDAQIQALTHAMQTLIPGFTLPVASPVTAHVPASAAPAPEPAPLPYTIQPQ